MEPDVSLNQMDMISIYLVRNVIVLRRFLTIRGHKDTKHRPETPFTLLLLPSLQTKQHLIGGEFLRRWGCNCIILLYYCCILLRIVLQVLRFTHSGDVGLHRQQVEEGEELNSEDSVNLRGRQHQHSQGQQHLGITLQHPTAMPLTQKHTQP